MGGIGGLISGIFGSSNDDAKTVNPYQTNSNAYQYGGAPGGAQAAAGLQGQRAQGSIEYGNALQGQQAQSYDQSQQSRGEQQQALDMAKQRAQGQNLISSQITQQQQQQAAAQQAGLAASARGPAALAQAQQQAAANTGQATAQLGAQGAIAGAQEQLANQQAFAAQAAGIRGQDLGAAGQSGQLALGNQQVAQGWAGLQNNINQSQLAAQMNEQAQNSANYNAAHGIQAGAAGQNAGMNQQNGMALLGGLASGGSSLLGGGGPKPGEAARGGRLPQGKPYLVGEEAPELVIPKRDGFVLNALQTAKVLGAPPTAQQMAGLSKGQRQALGEMQAPARGDGGQLRARMPLPMPRAEGGLIRSTWGTGPDVAVQPAAPMSYGAIDAPPLAPTTYGLPLSTPEQHELAERLALADAARQSIAYDPAKSAAAQAINARAQNTLATGERERALGIAPRELSPKDYAKATEAQRADSREAMEKKAMEKQARFALGKVEEEKAAAAETDEKKKQPERGAATKALGSVGEGLTKSAAGVDTGYHAADTYKAPTLLALPTYSARAEGGDFDVGNGVVLNKAGGLDAGASAKAMSDIATQYQRQGGSDPRSGGGAGQALGALGSSFMDAAKHVDTSFHPVGGYAHGGLIRGLAGRREEGGILASAAEHGARLIHHIASSVAEATQPEALFPEHRAPRAASTERTGYSATGTGHGAQAQTNGLIRPGPVTAPNKVVKGDDEEARACGGVMKAYAKGGMMLAKGGRKRRNAA